MTNFLLWLISSGVWFGTYMIASALDDIAKAIKEKQ